MISIVTGRIPRIYKTLNAYCTFGLFPKVCLVQDVYTLMLLYFCVLAFMCASVESYPLAHEIRLTDESYALGEFILSSCAFISLGNHSKLFVARMNLGKITR